jgi:hypothetical protein
MQGVSRIAAVFFNQKILPGKIFIFHIMGKPKAMNVS